MSTPERKIKCPRCGKDSIYSKENPYRPFCSERCQTIDLGHWAEGKYAIPVESTPEPESAELAESEDNSENHDPENQH